MVSPPELPLPLPSLEPVLSLVLPSPITVTWLSEASTGAVAPASVWLPDPVPSSPGGAPSRTASRTNRRSRPGCAAGVLLLSPITVTWLPEASTGAVAVASCLVAGHESVGT